MKSIFFLKGNCDEWRVYCLKGRYLLVNRISEAIKQLKNIEDLSIRQIVRITGLTYYEVYKA